MNLTILGCGSHAQMCAEIASLKNYDQIQMTNANDKEPGPIFLGMGNMKTRVKLAKMYSKQPSPALVSPAATLTSCRLGEGTLIGHGAVINKDVHIGRHCIVNTGAIIEHECIIGNLCIISPGAVLCGRVVLGERVEIGPGAVIGQGLTLCRDVLIGAGAVVTKDITKPGRYWGVPARLIPKGEK